jgi:hypothetical protein
MLEAFDIKFDQFIISIPTAIISGRQQCSGFEEVSNHNAIMLLTSDY